MRYHNITKDDMLNGDGLRVYSGLPAAITAVGNARIRSLGIQTEAFRLRKQKKQRSLQNWIRIISAASLFREVIRCIHPIFLRLLLSQKKFVRNIQIRRSGCIQVPYGKKSVMKRLYSIWMSVWTVNFRLIKEILLFAGRAHPISV